MISLLLFTVGVITWDPKWLIAAYLVEVVWGALKEVARR